VHPELLEDDPNTRPGYGAFNGVMIVDVTDKAEAQVVSAVGHDSAHTVMPHPTRPYLYILPGGLANGTNVPNQRISPTGIVDVSDPHEPGVRHLVHAQRPGLPRPRLQPRRRARLLRRPRRGAGVGHRRGPDREPPGGRHHRQPGDPVRAQRRGQPLGRYLAINDEAFGFHTCSGEAADLYGSLWIYDISVPEVPVLAGRIAPPGPPGDQGFGTLYDVGPVNGWADSWCAAHNYNWVPGSDDYIVASWFAGA
jgi:hypothetical protein